MNTTCLSRRKRMSLCSLLLCALPLSLSAQHTAYDSTLNVMHLKEYAVVTKTDTIHFLTTTPDKKKKTILFCQGSGPVPLIIKLPQGFCFPFPFQVDRKTRDEFNVVIISKPGLKRFATDADLSPEFVKNGSMLQLDSLNRPPEKYTANNSLYKLGSDCLEVIKFLKTQPWVDKDGIYIFGHSQGAMVAAYVAYKDKEDIKGLVYAQSNAYGMYSGYLSQVLEERLPENDLHKKIDSIYNLQASLLSDMKSRDVYDANTSRWRSLEEPPAIDYLLKTDMPILLVNGMASAGETDNKNIPLDFMRHNKHNLSVKFYPGYDHNFFKHTVDENGKPKEPEFHWDDVFEDVKKWINERK